MGWFYIPFISSAPAAPPAPDRSQRQHCWDARDAYFACLDAQKVLTPGQERGGACGAERAAYEGRCARSWVEYFNKRRVLQEEQKEQLAMAEAQAKAAKR